MHITSKYVQLNGFNILDHDNAADAIIPAPNQDLYLYIEKLVVSVYEPAIGGSGILEISDTMGNVFWRLNVDGVKDFELDFGSEGQKVGEDVDVGMQALLSGANTQAGVSIAIIAHLDID